MHGWETMMLLKHYLERGVSKTELSWRFGVSRRTIHEWIETGQLDRDLEGGAALIDRLLHHCHIVNIRGNSYRMREHRSLVRPASEQPRQGVAL